MRSRTLLHLVGLAMLTALGAGCGDDGPDVCNPLVPAGRIQGTVVAGGALGDATVRATRVVAGSGDFARFESKVGADGTYAVDVPAGRYVVGLRFGSSATPAYEYSAAGLRYGDAPPDTLLVDSRQSAPLVADFNLASMHVTVSLAAGLEGEMGSVRLVRRGAPVPPQQSTEVKGASASIAQSTLDVNVIGILPGNYKVEVVAGWRAYACDCAYDGEHFWIPSVRDSAASPWIEVAAGRKTEVAGQLQGPPARIQGRIMGAWQEFGMDTPYVALYAPDSSVVRGLRHVGADGRFDEVLYVPGPVKLFVRQASASSDQGADQWIGGADFASASVFALEPGQTIAGVELVESGLFVQASAPVQRLEWAWFRLYDAATRSLAAAWLVDYSDLEFGIPNLRPGAYLLQVEPYLRGWMQWVPQWYDRVGTAEEATPITIGQAGDIVRVPLVLERGGSIAGLVRDAQSATADHMVYVTPASRLETWGYTVVFDTSVQFLLKGLPDGDWKLGAWRRETNAGYPEEPPADTVWYPGGTAWEDATVLSTRGHSEITGIEIPIPAPRR